MQVNNGPLAADGQYTLFAKAIDVAGNTLLWQHGTLTLRLEGALTEAQALDLARSLR